ADGTLGGTGGRVLVSFSGFLFSVTTGVEGVGAAATAGDTAFQSARSDSALKVFAINDTTLSDFCPSVSVLSLFLTSSTGKVCAFLFTLKRSEYASRIPSASTLPDWPWSRNSKYLCVGTPLSSMNFNAFTTPIKRRSFELVKSSCARNLLVKRSGAFAD